MLVKLNVQPAICATSDQTLVSGVGLVVKGKIKEKNVPIPCRVRLFERISGRLIFETLTDSVGNYTFNHLSLTSFFVVAHHPQNQFNAVIADRVVPK